MKFTIQVDDADILAGITRKREQDGNLATDEEFVQVECHHLLKTFARESVVKDVQAEAEVAIKDYDERMKGKGY